MIRRSDLAKFDLWLIVFVVLLSLIGILTVYSAGFDAVTKINNGMYKKQIISFVIGLIIMGTVMFLNFRLIEQNCFYIYVGILLIVILTSFFAPSIRGIRAWINFGPFSIQPSEFMKIAAIVMLAKYLELRERDLINFRELFIPAVIVLIPVVAIMIQPDFGTAMVFIPILFVMLFAAGADITHLISIAAIAMISLLVPTYITYREWLHLDENNVIIDFFQKGYIVFIVITVLLLLSALFFALRFIFARKTYRRIYIPSLVLSIGFFLAVILQRSLKDYQKNRILVYLNPDLDPKGAGYNVIQSKIAIGSAGFFGKGYLSGTQTQFGFLPEKTSDFIFPVVVEEWGFLGALVVLLLTFGIIYQGLKISLEAKDKFSSLLAFGLSSLFLFHALINIGMVIGLTPVTGIPLCFVSYGGTNMMMSLLAVGILMSIKMTKTS